MSSQPPPGWARRRGACLADEDAIRRIREADADVAAGRLTTAEEMAGLMARRRRRDDRDA